MGALLPADVATLVLATILSISFSFPSLLWLWSPLPTKARCCSDGDHCAIAQMVSFNTITSARILIFFFLYNFLLNFNSSVLRRFSSGCKFLVRSTAMLCVKINCKCVSVYCSNWTCLGFQATARYGRRLMMT